MIDQSKKDENNTSLNTIVKGTFLVFTGSILSMLLAFAGRALFARLFSTSEYGFFSLGFTLLSISMVIGSLGLKDGTSRQIAFYKGKKENEKVNSVIFWSIVIGLLFGSFIFFIVFVFSDLIANLFFDMSDFSFPLRIFSIAIPFFVLINIFTSIFRGFKRVKENVYFTLIGRNLLFVLLLIPVVVLDLSFEWGIVAFVFSIILSCNFFVIYSLYRIPIDEKLTVSSLDYKIGKNLLIFSIPLLLVMILTQVMSWTDTLMLGFFKDSETVGLYNAAVPLGVFISNALGSMLFIYTPVVSDLFSQGKINEIRRSYTVLTKWIIVVTLPLTLVFVLFPHIVLNFFFGSEYLSAAIVLQVLAFGYFINNLMGPNGATLIAMGKTNFLMFATFAAACINIILNVVLIPQFGIMGAAVATVCSMISVNVIRIFKLYKISKIHSFDKNIFKPVIVSFFIIIIIYLIIKMLIIITYWMIPILFLFFIILILLMLFFTKSIDEEDILMLLSIEKKFGINLNYLKRFFKKFV